VAVKIKLKRMGKIRAPYYRVVVADSRTKRDGRAIEEIGIYHPKEDPSRMEVNSERVAYWLGVGAQPTDPVLAILKRTGDWQAFKGEPAPPPLLVAKPKASRTETYHAAVALAHADIDDSKAVGKAGSGTAPRRSKAAKEDKPAKDAGDAAPAGDAPAEAPAAAEAPTEEPAGTESTAAADSAGDAEAKA
jgi:small subunit ribosomal protein S16